ncbi:MAG: DUF3822 family protein [Bacteroidales bacterium]|nr:DUF3822 family protein [Bacteroidales bacterium]MEA4839613.1 DUF3822 family protein [Bacteroidales bacterium]
MMQENRNQFQPYQRTLSIRSTPNGFSFCTSTVKSAIYKELKMASNFDFPERFEDYIQSRGWSERENLSVTITDFAEHFMVLPLEITDTEQIKTFFNFQFQHEEECQIFTTPLSDNKQLFCWEIANERVRCFERLFQKLTIFSSAFLLADWVVHQPTIKQQAILVAHLYGNSMQVFIGENHTLLFANTFPMSNRQELPYFLLRCMEQLSLDPNHTYCVFCSESVPEQEIFEIFSSYLQHIKIATFTHQIEEPLLFTEGKKDSHANR